MAEAFDELAGLPLWLPEVAAVSTPEPVYVVVDELAEGVAGLVVTRWPRRDSFGAPRFDEEADFELSVDARRLEELLPIDELKIGDAFAAQLRQRPTDELETVQEATQWLGPPFVDVSDEAREAAKTQYYAALAGVLTPDEL